MRGRGGSLILARVARLGSLPVAALAVMTWACSPPTLPASLARAESLELQHKDADALTAYDDALAGCTPARPRRPHAPAPAPVDCGRAALERADLLYDLHRYRDAVAAYDEASRLPWASLVQARALEREAEIDMDPLADDNDALALAWQVIDRHPDAASAPAALALVLRVQRGKDARALYDRLAAAYASLRGTALAPNLLYAAGDLAEHEIGDPRTALARYDELAAGFPDSGLWDDALWAAVKLARTLDDPEGAIQRCRRLLSTRRRAVLVGSFGSDYDDLAADAIGDIYAEDEKDLAHAALAWRQFLDDFPESRLRPRVMLKLARAEIALGDPARACDTLAALAKEYGRTFLARTDGASLRQKLACKETP